MLAISILRENKLELSSNETVQANSTAETLQAFDNNQDGNESNLVLEELNQKDDVSEKDRKQQNCRVVL